MSGVGGSSSGEGRGVGGCLPGWLPQRGANQQQWLCMQPYAASMAICIRSLVNFPPVGTLCATPQYNRKDRGVRPHRLVVVSRWQSCRGWVTGCSLTFLTPLPPPAPCSAPRSASGPGSVRGPGRASRPPPTGFCVPTCKHSHGMAICICVTWHVLLPPWLAPPPATVLTCPPATLFLPSLPASPLPPLLGPPPGPASARSAPCFYSVDSLSLGLTLGGWVGQRAPASRGLACNHMQMVDAFRIR